MAASQDPSNGHSLESHKELVQWVTNHGGYIADTVFVAQDDTRGVHIQVRTDLPEAISKETRVINTPLNVTMSYFNAIDYTCPKGSFSSHGVVFPREFIDAVGKEETTAFYLMGQFLRGEEGFWFPYLRTLPQPGQLTTPLFFGEHDVDWLQGTGIPDASVFRYKHWDKKFDEGMAKLEELGFEGLEMFTWELYLWASTIITSRAFSPKVLSGAVEEADLPEDSVPVLLPLIDLPNHRPLAKVEWRAGDADVGLLVQENVSPGEEISNNYGPRNNEQLLVNYGFCILNNPTDYRIVKLGLPEESPLGQAKARQAKMFPELAKAAEDHYYIFNIFYPLLAQERPMEHSIFSPALFSAIAVMQANKRERRKLEITETGISIPGGYGSGRNTLAVLAQISFELIAHIAHLQETAEDLPEHPSNLKQTFAQIYRNGQITLDKTALIIAAWTISRAREHQRGEDWEDIKVLLNDHMQKIPTDHFSHEIMSRIRVRVLERPSLLSKNGELFRLGEIYSLLPAEMQAPSQQCFAHILGEASSQRVPALKTDPQAMFALVVNLLVATRRSPQAQSHLSSRLIRWVDFLLEEYPLQSSPEDECSGVLEQLGAYVQNQGAQSWTESDGVTWLDSESGWLNSKWLQWAWRVVNGEMVLIPLDPLQVLTNSPAMPKQAVLYVPQE
ncbi:unnamed protein product [Penicillium pancosmium]